jgi:hypothetical protein
MKKSERIVMVYDPEYNICARQIICGIFKHSEIFRKKRTVA